MVINSINLNNSCGHTVSYNGLSNAYLYFLGNYNNYEVALYCQWKFLHCEH